MNGYNQYKTYTLGNGKSSTNTYFFGMPTSYVTAGVQNLTLNWNYNSGNLSNRVDGIVTKTESFTYDNLNRLTSSAITGLATQNIAYATNGNITSKTDAGTYEYTHAKINAVTRINPSAGNISSSTQSLPTYTSFLQPASISEGTNILAYTYGSDENRIKSTLTQNGSVTNSRYYLGDYEKDITGGTTKHIHYISAGDGLMAIVIRENGTDTYYYTYTDHLGSLLHVTNSAGTVTNNLNYDAWGRYRNSSTWAYTSVTTPPAWLTRGYTGHEHLSLFGIINMNGRLYDPVVGRMLAVDNNVQAPDFTQNFNRYSYALNNPLKYTDPDGELIIEAILAGMAMGGGIHTLSHLSTHNSFKGWNWGAFIGSIAAGAVGGAIAPTLAAAQIGGFYGGAITGAASGFAGALTSGIINKEKFGNLIGHAFTGAIIGGAIGGVIGGIDATFKDHNFLDGKGIPTERYITGTGNNPKISEVTQDQYYNDVIGNSDVNSVGNNFNDPLQRGVGDGINTQNFRGRNLDIKIRATPKEGERFFINVNGKEVFSTNYPRRMNLSIKSGNTIQWGLLGIKSNSISGSTIGNTIYAVDPSSYLIIKGIHRSWGGLLIWH